MTSTKRRISADTKKASMTAIIDTNNTSNNNTPNSSKPNNITKHKNTQTIYSSSVNKMDDTSKPRAVVVDKGRQSASIDGTRNGGTILDEKTTEIRQNESSENHASLVASGVLQSTVPIWANLLVVGGLIFGGCCSNV